MNGDLAAVNLASAPWGAPCGAFSLVYNFGAVITRGPFGLLAWVGSTTFQQLQVQTNDPYLKNAPMHMLAAAAPTGPASGVTDLTMAEVDSLLPAAINRPATTLSLDAAAIAELEAANLEIAALPDGGLGATSGDTITLSPDAAGWGWFIDPSPYTDSAFTVATADGLAAVPGSAASNEMDLLTVEMHELEHVLGYGDISSGLMSEYLTPGTRLAPPVNAAGISAGATAGLKAGEPSASSAFALAAQIVAPVIGSVTANGDAASDASGATASAAPSAMARVGGFLFGNALAGGDMAYAPAAGGYAGSLVQSTIVVAPTVFGLSAGRAVSGDSFVQIDEYLGWSGELASGQSAAPQFPPVGDSATAWPKPSSALAPTSHPADTPGIA